MFREFDYDNKPVTEIVDEIIDDSVNSGVSDIHMDPDANGIKVRLRVDGDLHDYCYIPDSVKRNLTTRVKIISGMNITEMRLPQDGAIKKMYGEQQVDMRVSSLPTIHGEKIVIRILDYSRSLAGLETLGFSDHNLELIKKVTKEFESRKIKLFFTMGVDSSAVSPTPIWTKPTNCPLPLQVLPISWSGIFLQAC